MSGRVDRRALLALHRNHPATAPGDRYNWKASAEASRQREMLLGWAATQTDETLLSMRNLGPVALQWIREQSGDPPSPFADLEAENAQLREALEIIAANPEHAPDAIGVTARNIARAALARLTPEDDTPPGAG